MGVDDNHCEVAYHSAKRSGVKGTEAHRRQWDWSLPPAVRERGRRNVGNHKERRKPRLCEFPGSLTLAGTGVEPQTGFGAIAQKTTRENAVSEQAAQQPTIETGAIRKAGIQTRIRKYVVTSLANRGFTCHSKVATNKQELPHTRGGHYMNSIIYVGMDVHTTNYTLCCFSPDKDRVFAVAQVEPDYLNILKYLKRVEKNIGKPCQFLCGYEAGCLGYSLYHQLTESNVECVILAPTTMMSSAKQIKTDRRDAEKIAKCLAFNTYKPVYIPTEEDNAVKEYIRMRDDAKSAAKRYKQQILSFCVRHGKCFEGKGHWTNKHRAWLTSLDFGNTLLQETFQEYLRLLDQTLESLERFENKINELANSERYAERTRRLNCFLGIANVIALAVLAEVGDFNRFSSASQFASYLGLVPGEYSSGDKRCRSGITKAGNSHIRKLLTEAAQCYSRGKTGAKSVTLKRKQAGNSPDIIAYADRANDRLRKKFRKTASHSNRNIAATAVARELACFIWGMMTDHTA